MSRMLRSAIAVLEHFPIHGLHPSRRAQMRAPTGERNCVHPGDEVSDPHGEERGNAARLEPRGHVKSLIVPSEWNTHSAKRPVDKYTCHGCVTKQGSFAVASDQAPRHRSCAPKRSPS